MGDIAFPMFPFARQLKKAPPLIAREVARLVSESPDAQGAGQATAAGPYVNVRLAPTPVIDDILSEVAAQGEAYGRGTEQSGRRVMLEFSCPNTNKPLHLGHLRNDAIGESLSRILAAAGATLQKVNLINDRGVHICKSMLAYRMFGGSATPESEGVKGDHFVGDYYVKYAQIRAGPSRSGRAGAAAAARMGGGRAAGRGALAEDERLGHRRHRGELPENRHLLRQSLLRERSLQAGQGGDPFGRREGAVPEGSRRFRLGRSHGPGDGARGAAEGRRHFALHHAGHRHRHPAHEGLAL